MKPIKKQREKKYQDKYYETRRAAFRAAKRDSGIAVSQQPEEVIKPNDKKWKEYGLDQNKNRALYRFIVYLLNLFTGYSEEQEVHLREDRNFSYGAFEGKGDQDDHFNSGEVNDAADKLKRHHYFKRRKKR